jgi:acid phosphatase
VVEENHSLAQMQAGMPYLDALAGRFGYASNWSAAGHPSLPNYLAIAGGATFGVTDDAPPANHPLPGDSVFDQALAEGRTAKIYADSMPGSCTPVSIGRYAVKHNPWAYFSEAGQRTNCQSYDVPAGSPDSGELASDITAGRLPNAGMLVPNLCDDGHDCSLATADAYLRSWLPQILAGPDFSSGRLAVVITADEDDSANGNHVLTVVLHHSLDGTGTVVRTPLNHYSLTRFYGQVDDTAPLRLAGSAPDLRAAFGLP